jgi:hypothetical protein
VSFEAAEESIPDLVVVSPFAIAVVAVVVPVPVASILGFDVEMDPIVGTGTAAAVVTFVAVAGIVAGTAAASKKAEDLVDGRACCANATFAVVRDLRHGQPDQ